MKGTIHFTLLTRRSLFFSGATPPSHGRPALSPFFKRTRPNVFKRNMSSEAPCNVTINKVMRDMYLLTYRDQKKLSKTFLRFQEYYESPVFRHQYFTFEQFQEWYIVNYGKFSYETDWIGYNIPSSIVETFENGAMNPLSEEEHHLINILKQLPKPYYILGVNSSLDPGRCQIWTSEEANSDINLSATLVHEISHGLFYLNPSYASKATSFLEQLGPQADRIYSLLNRLGYHQEVWTDEAIAYIVSECPNHSILTHFGVDLTQAPWPALHSELQRLFLSFYKENTQKPLFHHRLSTLPPPFLPPKPKTLPNLL